MAMLIAPRGLYPFGEQIDKFPLRFEMSVVEEVELIKCRADYLPVMLFIHISKRDDVGKKLVDVFRTRLTDILRQCDRKLDDLPERLYFMPVLVGQGPHTLEDIAIFNRWFFTAILLLLPPGFRRMDSEQGWG